MDEVLRLVQQSEQLGSEVVSKRREIIEFDRRRNKNREALRALTRVDKNDNKLWMCSGNMFIKSDAASATAMITKDQSEITSIIDKLRDDIKGTVGKLETMEGRDTSRFDLKSLSKAESSALRDLLPSAM
ncbi:p53 and DNA damage-regulated protein 1 [Halotydeus destructor]|nr:p53 and DNA damage-regulated protein 1 [Halotydeus destructor]